MISALTSSKKRFYIIFGIILLATLAGGWAFTDHLIRSTTSEVLKDSRKSNFSISMILYYEMTTVKGAVEAMSGSPFMARALISRNHKDIDRANGALDRYNKAIGSSVSYLLDKNGKTIASSNRNSRESFVGRSYSFRSYFQEAIGGNNAILFAVGTTTNTRGFYASAPVKTSGGRIIGVAVMKKDLDDIEIRLGQHGQWFLLSPDGIIFLSSRADARLKRLWPLDNHTRSKIQLSMQFGAKTFESVLSEKLIDGSVVTLDGNSYLTNLKDFGYGGWSIVVMTPRTKIQNYRTFGIIISIFFGTLLLGPYMTIYISRRLADHIKESEKRFMDIMYASADTILLISGEKFIDCNEATVQLLGYKNREEVLMTHPSEMSPSTQTDGRDSFEKANEMMKIAFENGYHRFEWTHRKANGEVFPVEVSLTSIMLKGKNILYCMWHDMTDLKRVEIKLKEQGDMYRMLTEQSFAGTYVIQDGVFKFINSAAAAYAGYTPEELLGKPSISLLVHPDDREIHKECAQDMVKGRRKEPYEFRMLSKLGEVRWIMETIVPITFGGRAALLGNSMDITAQKQAEETLNKAYKEVSTLQANLILQQKMASIGQLSAGISHEINNPMGFITGNLDVLKTYMTHLETIIKRQADMILRHHDAPDLIEAMEAERKRLKIDYILRDAPTLIDESLAGAERVSSIVRNLKTFAADSDAEFHEADVNEGLSGAIDIMRSELTQGVELITSLGRLPKTRCNIGQLSQAFIAILENAVQAIGSKGEIRIDTRQENDLIIISISDTGVGIDDDLKDRIFEPFFTTREVGQGIGLGLSTAYDIIKKHKGEITVESVVGQGSTFTIRIPVVR